MSVAQAKASPRDLIRDLPPDSSRVMVAEAAYFSDHTRVYFFSALVVMLAMVPPPARRPDPGEGVEHLVEVPLEVLRHRGH
jgi:hypothetical protein